MVEVPVVDGQWRPVLPAIDLETLDDAERQRGAECFETHGVTNPEVSLGELMAAAACLRGARQYGREVSMVRLVLQRRPQAPIASEATRLCGETNGE